MGFERTAIKERSTIYTKENRIYCISERDWIQNIFQGLHLEIDFEAAFVFIDKIYVTHEDKTYNKVQDELTHDCYPNDNN